MGGGRGEKAQARQAIIDCEIGSLPATVLWEARPVARTVGGEGWGQSVAGARVVAFL